jgi:peptidyl-prolyl cis-trans isomerase SurA
MLSKFNRKNDSLLVITEGKWFKGDDPLIDKIQWRTGSQFLKINNYPSVFVIKKIIEPVPLPFNEIQGEMMTGYQDYLENEWIKQLKEQYAVKIDNQVFDEVKKSLINE